MKVQDIDELKILKYVTHTIGSQAIIDYITAGGSIDTLKELGLITRTVPTEIIEEEIGISGYLFTITPTPADATVVINDTEQTSVRIATGETAAWSVSKEGYVSQSGTYVMGDSDYSIEVELEEVIDYESTPFTVKVLENGVVTLNSDHYTGENANCYYKLNDGEWTSFVSNTASINVTTDDTIQIKGVNYNVVIDEGGGSGSGSGSGSGQYPKTHIIDSTCNIDIYGNILSLLYGDNFIGKENIPLENKQFIDLFNSSSYHPQPRILIVSAQNLILPSTSLSLGCYQAMFGDCTSLATAPALPATTLAESCYSNIFYKCTSLTTSPQLPATTLANYCYAHMFDGCRSLTTAPELPATTLADSCYEGMFVGCTSLTTAPQLPATTLVNGCYQTMFSGCTSLTTAPELPATTLDTLCYSNMFMNCTSLTTAPELPATTLAASCYAYMFSGCTSLTTAPELPATTLTNYCYSNMFYNCTSLNYIKCLATNISASNCTFEWVKNVASEGTFVKDSTTTWETGIHGIPEGWTVQDA